MSIHNNAENALDSGLSHFLSQQDHTVLANTVMLLSVVSLLLIAALAYHIYMLAKTKRHNVRKSHLVHTSPAAYFLHHIPSDSCKSSLTLLDMLHITTQPNDIDSLFALIDDDNKEKLSTLYKNLLAGNTNQKHIILSSHSSSTGENTTIECYGEYVTNAYGDVEYVILWFMNISRHTQEHASLTSDFEELKQSLKFYSSLYDNVPFPIWKRDKDLHITTCNPAYSNIVNIENDEEQPIPELCSDSEHLAKLVYNSRNLHREEQHIVVSGQRRLYAITEVPIYDQSNSYYHIGFGRDITELEEARNQIKRYISAQEDLLESSGCASAIFAPDTRLKFYNNSFASLWALDQNWLDSEPTYGDFLEILREKRKLPEQHNFPKFKKDQLQWFTSLIEPHDDFIHLPDGRALRVIIIPHALGGLLISYEDITDKLEFERSYNTLIAVQQATLDHLHEGVCVLGQDGHITLKNPTYATLWNLSDDFLERKPHISEIMEETKDFYYVSEEWKQFKDDMIAKSFKRTSSLHHIERTDGSVVDVMNVPLPDGATLMAYLDVTDTALVERSLRERNDALEEADTLKTEFLANVSYELRSPLTSILGFSDILQQEMFGPLTNKQKEYVKGIFTSSEQLMSLINDTLDLSSIDAGYMELHTQHIKVRELLMSIQPLISERLKKKKIIFDLQCPNNIGKILADEQRIKQVLFKLLSNAIKFTPSEGHIILGAKRAKKGDIAIWVEDNGIGIAEDEQQHIFQKFYRTSTAEKQHEAGAGLGLSIVKNFIQLHGGNIDITSSPGKGTTITCTLPRESETLIKSIIDENSIFAHESSNIIFNDL